MIGIRRVLGLLVVNLLLGRAALAQINPGANGPRAFTMNEYGAFTSRSDVTTREVEFLGRAYYPSVVNSGERLPLVLFLHGDHVTCYATANPTVL